MRGREICVTDVPSRISPVASPGGTQGLHGLEVLGPFFDLKTKNTLMRKPRTKLETNAFLPQSPRFHKSPPERGRIENTKKHPFLL